MQNNASSSPAMLAAILLIVAGGIAFALTGGSYFTFVIAIVALTTIVGVGLNVLVGLTGQISLGHVGFFAIGAYAVAILNLAGVNFWLAFIAGGVVSGAVGALLALPAMRVTGPYLAMVTIAFGLIVEHTLIELRDLTGGQNGLMGFSGPSIGDFAFTEREMAVLAIVLAGLSLWFFDRLAKSGWGRAMIAVRDAEIAARSVALQPLAVKVAAFAISAALTGLAGGLYAPLMSYIAPSSFMFSQSIIFLFAVIVGGVGWTLGPVFGALVTVLLPELLSGLAEYRLLFFGTLLAAVLLLAPSGIVGALARFVPKFGGAARRDEAADAPIAEFLSRDKSGPGLTVSDIGINLRGHPRRERGEPQGPARSRHQHHRAERRGQDDRAEHDRLLLPSGFRLDPPWRDRAGRAIGDGRRARGHLAYVSDDETIPVAERDGQHPDWPAPRAAGQSGQRAGTERGRGPGGRAIEARRL
jgi:ABC-type branched-subunit amino acid transport system permease subunit